LLILPPPPHTHPLPPPHLSPTPPPRTPPPPPGRPPRPRRRMGFLSGVWAVPSSASRYSEISSGCTTIPARLASLNAPPAWPGSRSEEHTSELQSLTNLVCRLLLE